MVSCTNGSTDIVSINTSLEHEHPVKVLQRCKSLAIRDAWATLRDFYVATEHPHIQKFITIHKLGRFHFHKGVHVPQISLQTQIRGQGWRCIHLASWHSLHVPYTSTMPLYECTLGSAHLQYFSQDIIGEQDIHIWRILEIVDPQNHGFHFFNTKMVYFFIIWGTTILGNHVKPPFFVTTTGDIFPACCHLRDNTLNHLSIARIAIDASARFC